MCWRPSCAPRDSPGSLRAPRRNFTSASRVFRSKSNRVGDGNAWNFSYDIDHSSTTIIVTGVYTASGKSALKLILTDTDIYSVNSCTRCVCSLCVHDAVRPVLTWHVSLRRKCVLAGDGFRWREKQTREKIVFFYRNNDGKQRFLRLRPPAVHSHRFAVGRGHHYLLHTYTRFR